MSRQSVLPVLLLSTLCVSLPAGAVPVTLVSQERYVHTYYMGTPYDKYAPDWGPFNEGVYPHPGYVYATQESTVGLTSSGHLHAHGAGGGAGGGGMSYVNLTFFVDEPVQYQFQASMEDYTSYDGNAGNWASLRGPGGAWLFYDSAGNVSRSGLLNTGTYSFEIYASAGQGSQGGSGWAQTDFTFSVIPEPTTLAMLIVGLFGCSIRRKHFRSRRA